METLSKSESELEFNDFLKTIRKAGSEDTFHADNVTRQIDSLALLMDRLSKNHENGINDKLIGFYYHICKSLMILEGLKIKL